MQMIMMLVMLVIGLGTLIGLFANAGQKLFLWFGPFFTGVNPLVFGIVYGMIEAAVMALFVLSRMPDSRIPRVVFLVDHYALGVAVYVMLAVNLASLVLLICRLCHLLPTPLPQAVTVVTGIVALALAVAVSVYGGIHASVIRTKNYEIALQTDRTETDKAKSDKAEQASMRIVLISDIHLGYVIDEKHVKKIVAAVNAAEPDLVCIAGDIFDGDITAVKNPSVLQELFREIKAPYGVYACLGNHDAGTGYEEMLEFLDKAQIRLLQDEEVLIADKIILAGRKDSGPIGGQGEKRAALADVAEESPPEAAKLPRIILDHRPENIGEYHRSTDLILCGHTHRGQMFPFNLVEKAVLEVDYGYYRQDEESPQAIVTSGVGTWGPPQRVGTDNEVVMIQVICSVG